MEKVERPYVVVLDAGSPQGTSIVRCLALEPRYKVVGLSFVPNEMVHYSRHCRIIKRLDWNWRSGPERVMEFVKRFPDAILLPGSTDAVLWMARHKQVLSSCWKMPLLASEAALRIAVNKGKLATALIDWNLPGLPAALASQILKQPELAQFPAIVKPSNRTGGMGVSSFNSPESLMPHLEALENPDDFIVQRYISGQELSCGVLCDAGRLLACVIYRPLTRRSQFGPYLSVEFVQDAKVFELVSQVMQKLEWSGVANLDIRYDEQNENPYVLEINARFWGNIVAAAVQGVNFPDLVCRLASDELIKEIDASEPGKIAGKEFFGSPDAFRSLKQVWRNSGKLRSLWQNSMLQTIFHDPLPTVYNYWKFRM